MVDKRMFVNPFACPSFVCRGFWVWVYTQPVVLSNHPLPNPLDFITKSKNL